MYYPKAQKNKGATLIEMLIYIIIFSFLSVVIFNAVINMTKSFQAVAVDTELMKASLVMERMSREVRNSYDVLLGGGGDYIKLYYMNEWDQADARAFNLLDGNLELWEDEYSTGSLIGQLNSENLEIVALTYGQITTLQGKALTFSITVRARLYGSTKEATFQNTVVLRGAY